jgi:hypothetical protein
MAPLGFALLAQSASPIAHAALGGDATSVETDRVNMKGQARVTSIAGYTVHEITLPSGTVVREYISPAGKVFAVSWRGPVKPDLSQTLGAYFGQFQAASKSQLRGQHHHLAVQEPDLVVQSAGRMRAFYGKAYVPSLLPQNFSVDNIE